MQSLTLPKLAARNGWSVTRMRRLVANHARAHIQVNGRLPLPENAIDEFVAKNFAAPAIAVDAAQGQPIGQIGRLLP